MRQDCHFTALSAGFGTGQFLDWAQVGGSELEIPSSASSWFLEPHCLAPRLKLLTHVAENTSYGYGRFMEKNAACHKQSCFQETGS